MPFTVFLPRSLRSAFFLIRIRTLVMTITVNGEEKTIKRGATVQELLWSLEIGLKGCAVELNIEIVPKSEYGSTMIKEGDRLEIIQMVGGG